MELKNIEKENISLLNAELAASHFLTLDEYHIRKSMIKLQKEISEDLSAIGPDKALLIYELNEYMNKEDNFYNSESAYKYGKISCKEGLSFEDGFAQYRRLINNKIIKSHSKLMQNKLYIEIAGLISNISILKDYMNVYKKIKSIKRDNLVQFYRLGYEYAKAHK